MILAVPWAKYALVKRVDFCILFSKKRCLFANTATDDDWNAVKKRADYFGVSISRLVIETILKKPVSDDESPSPVTNELLDAQREMLREVLILGAIARDNMEQRGAGEKFDAITKKIGGRLNSI